MTAALAQRQPTPPGHVQPVDDALRLDMAEHSICFVLPKGGVLTGDLDLPGGALIYGSLSGRIRCRDGSLILAEGSEFVGKAEAPLTYICGTVRSIAKGQASEITGSALVAVSSTAGGRATLISRQFAIHSRTFAGVMRSIE